MGRQKIKINLTEIGFGDVDWIHLAHDMDLAGSCEHENEPCVSIKCGEFLDYLSVLLASEEELCFMS
jgi:hypothetical protein